MSALQIKLGPKPTGNEINDVKKIVVLRPAAHNNHPPCAGIRVNRNHGAIGHRAESPHLHSDQGFKFCCSFRRLVHIGSTPDRSRQNFSCSFGRLVQSWHLALCRFFPGCQLAAQTDQRSSQADLLLGFLATRWPPSLPQSPKAPRQSRANSPRLKYLALR